MVPGRRSKGPGVEKSLGAVFAHMSDTSSIVSAVPPWATTGNLCAQVRETHTGVVILIGDKAYKVKKSVVTDFLDFSTPDRRERACDSATRCGRQ